MTSNVVFRPINIPAYGQISSIFSLSSYHHSLVGSLGRSATRSATVYGSRERWAFCSEARTPISASAVPLASFDWMMFVASCRPTTLSFESALSCPKNPPLRGPKIASMDSFLPESWKDNVFSPSTAASVDIAATTAMVSNLMLQYMLFVILTNKCSVSKHYPKRHLVKMIAKIEW